MNPKNARTSVLENRTKHFLLDLAHCVVAVVAVALTDFDSMSIQNT